MFLGSFKGVSKSFKCVSMMSEGMVKIISKKFKGCFKKVLKLFDRFFKGDYSPFQGCFKTVLTVLVKIEDCFNGD